MSARTWFCVGLLVGLSGAIPGTATADDGWMRPGVRVWYLGAVDGGGLTSSNAEEAYLFDAVAGTDAQIVHHSALTHWTLPKQVETNTYTTLDMGPCWIHPLRLQTLKSGDYWMGHMIAGVVPATTYATLPYQLLPAKALSGINPDRGIVKILYTIPGFSSGVAYFDADTGILLYYNSLWGTNKMFFILSEINYDFARHAAFPEDDGPHTGFKSFVSEQSLGSTWGVGGGSVVVQSLVESRYGKTIEMRVMSSISGPYGAKQADENHCFFGDVPIVRAIDATQAPNYPPEQWTAFGQYLWWWLPPAAAGAQSINVIEVPLARAADQPLTFTATAAPARFYFSALWFDAAGYLTQFGAKDPSIGLDVQPGDMYFQNLTSVDGVAYYRTTMAKPFPGVPRGDFTGDLKADVLWRHATGGDVWLWPMNGAARTAESYVRTVADTTWEIRSQGDQTGDGKADLLWRNTVTGQLYFWPMDGATPQDEIYVGMVDTAYDIVGTGDFDGDGKSDVLWRNPANGEVWIWLMSGATPLSQVYIDRVDPGYVVKGVGDLDADGKADIVWHGAAGDVWVWPMSGTTRLAQVWVGTVPDTEYQIQGVADFDGNGKADLVWWHAMRGEVWLWTMNGPARQAEDWVGTVPDTNYQIAATGDYNGDGKSDLLWRNVVNGEVWLWLMDGATRLSETWVATVPDTGYRIVK